MYIEPGRFGCGYTARPAGGVEWTLVSYGDGVHVSSAFPGIGVTRHRGHDLYRDGCVVRPPRDVSSVFSPGGITSIYIYRKPHRGSTVSLASKVLSVWAGSTPDPAMNIGKLVLRKPDDRAPVGTSTLPNSLSPQSEQTQFTVDELESRIKGTSNQWHILFNTHVVMQTLHNESLRGPV